MISSDLNVLSNTIVKALQILLLVIFCFLLKPHPKLSTFLQLAEIKVLVWKIFEICYNCGSYFIINSPLPPTIISISSLFHPKLDYHFTSFSLITIINNVLTHSYVKTGAHQGDQNYVVLMLLIYEAKFFNTSMFNLNLTGHNTPH